MSLVVFGIGGTEFLLIGLALLILFGPERLPQVAREIGKVRGRLKEMGRELNDALDIEELDEDDEDGPSRRTPPQGGHPEPGPADIVFRE